MDFPHLNDTQFPNLENVNAYGYENRFDYTRWVPNTRLYLTNVRWNGDYRDCVKFESDEARDKWFDEHIQDQLQRDPNCTIELKTNTVLVNKSVKVPVPYDHATQFNYLVVDVPVMTSDDRMLDYETKDGFRRWHFFIDNFDSSAPSVTTLMLSLDVWTQYINSVGFNYFMLERGHAPVAKSDTDKFLANPMDNCEYLLCPDVNFGGETVSRGGKFIPFGNGEKYICFASTCTVSQLTSVGTVVNSSSYSWSDPVFSDETAYPDSDNRWGRQYHVEGYRFGNGKSYANTTTPSGNSFTQDGRIPNNVTVYAIKASEANAFVNDCMSKSPTFLKTIVACFMVAKEMLTLGNAHSLAGHNINVCTGNEFDLGDVKLTKDMFGVPDRYQRFAKLFTSPYSELEITDNNGQTVTVGVEETSGIKAHGIASLAYPYLNMRMFLTGIGGVGSTKYQWQDLKGNHDVEMSYGDWYRFCYDMDVPMYSLYMDGLTSWEITNYNRSVSNARSSALVGYHNTVREANNAMHNAKDTADVANTNAVASANTAQTNANNSAQTAKTNTNNDASNINKNNANQRSCATDITANNTATSTANMALDNELQRQIVNENNTRDAGNTATQNQMSANTVKEENETSITCANQTALATAGGVAGNAAAAAVTGFFAGGPVGAAAGAGMSIAQGAGQLASAATQVLNTQATTQCNSAVNALSMAAATEQCARNGRTNQTNYENTRQYNVKTNDNNNKLATDNTARNNSCNAANTANTVGTMQTNASNTYDTVVTNAGNTRNTAVANSGRSKSNTYSTSNWTNRSGIAAAQAVLRNTQAQAKANLNDSKNANAVQLCVSGGDFTPDYMRTRGVQVKARTQSKQAIRSAGDEFVRYGYMLNQIWEMDELCLMNHYTYWKAKDCWVYDKCETSDLAQRSISDIFQQGVTVWSDPNEIGRVNPYDN